MRRGEKKKKKKKKKKRLLVRAASAEKEGGGLRFEKSRSERARGRERERKAGGEIKASDVSAPRASALRFDLQMQSLSISCADRRKKREGAMSQSEALVLTRGKGSLFLISPRRHHVEVIIQIGASNLPLQRDPFGASRRPTLRGYGLRMPYQDPTRRALDLNSSKRTWSGSAFSSSPVGETFDGGGGVGVGSDRGHDAAPSGGASAAPRSSMWWSPRYPFGERTGRASARETRKRTELAREKGGRGGGDSFSISTRRVERETKNQMTSGRCWANFLFAKPMSPSPSAQQNSSSSSLLLLPLPARFFSPSDPEAGSGRVCLPAELGIALASAVRVRLGLLEGKWRDAATIEVDDDDSPFNAWREETTTLC